MSAFLYYLFKILLWAIAIMTGVLAILRESLSIFVPHQAPPRSLFWSCVIIAFVISAAILWYQEHRKVMGNKPKLDAKFDVFSVAPAGEKNEDSIIIISATITNVGAPSIVQNIRIEIERENKCINGQFLPWPKGELRLEGENRSFVIKNEDALSRKCLSQPIATGGGVNGYCFLLFSGLKTEDVYKLGTIIILTFNDVFGKKYCFKKDMSEKGPPPPDITRLQKKE